MADEPYVPATYGCGGCDTRWTGVSRCHCSGCHKTFGGIALFDLHRREKPGRTPEDDAIGYCKDPATITRKGQQVMWETDGIWRGAETVTNPIPPRRTSAA